MFNWESIGLGLFVFVLGIFLILLAQIPMKKHHNFWLKILRVLYGRKYKSYLPKGGLLNLKDSKFYAVAKVIICVIGVVYILVGLIVLIVTLMNTS